MIYIPRSLVRQARIVFGKAFGTHKMAARLPVELIQTGTELTIRAQQAGIVAAYSCGQASATGSLIVPLELFTDCQGNKHDDVAISQRGDTIQAEWTDRGMPFIRSYEPPRVPATDSFAATPAEFTQAGTELMPALAAVNEVCDHESSRYALSNILLRGTRGDLVATDGRQILQHGGFTLGLKDDVLIPGSKLYGCAQLHAATEVAKTDDHLVLRVAGWTVWLPINKEGRFPRVDDIIPKPDQAVSHIEFAPGDLQFLGEQVARLPADEGFNHAVTLDLNGDVAVRGANTTASTELVLTNSRRDGSEVRVATDRRFLERAVKLGFDRLYLFGQDRPVLCQDERRTYLWMLLDKDSVVARRENTLRVESPAPGGIATKRKVAASVERPPSPSAPTNRIANSMPTVETNPTSVQATETVASGTTTDSIASPIEQVLAVREELRAVLEKTNALARSLKQQRRQERLMRTTLANLKQLQVAG